MGVHLPNPMATKTVERRCASLTDALFAATQRRLLAYLFDGCDRGYSVSELIRLTNAGSGAVQRELAKLAGSGLLVVELVGHQKRYRANHEAPIHGELVNIVCKTFGLAVPLRRTLQCAADRIHLAFVHGSVAKGADTVDSDINLMIVSDTLGYGEAYAILEPLMQHLGRGINPTVQSLATLGKHITRRDPFIARVRTEPKIWLHGRDTGLAALLHPGGRRLPP